MKDALAAAALLLTAGVAAADIASPLEPWERYRTRNVLVHAPDDELHHRIEKLRPTAAAVGGGPFLTVEFRHPDGRPLDWGSRAETVVTDKGPFHTAPAWVATGLAAAAVVLGWRWAARRARRSEE